MTVSTSGKKTEACSVLAGLETLLVPLAIYMLNICASRDLLVPAEIAESKVSTLS